MNTLNNELKKIRRLLIDTKLSYAEIAKRAGVHWKTVSRISAGIEENPRINTLSSIERAIADGEFAHVESAEEN